MTSSASTPHSPLAETSDAQTVAVVGAGICGLFTSLALSRRGFDVTLFERDTPPPEGDADQAFFTWERRGAAQFRHPHAFLGLMCSVLEEHYPDLLEDFFAAGARKVAFADTIPDQLKDQYQPEPGDEKMWVLMCRRATMETVVRRYVERNSTVQIENSKYVTQVFTEACTENLQNRVATGIELTDRIHANQKSRHSADIIVDATGRASKFDRWLKAQGVQVTEQRDDAEIVYYTRHYQLLPGISEPKRDSRNPSAGDLGYMKYGVFPGDNGHFALIICLPNAEHELREAIKSGAHFDDICMTIPGLRPWISPAQAKPTTAPFGIGQIHAVWRDYVHDQGPRLLNFFAVGDSAIRTNPLYGRGCSTGTLHAHILADVLADTSDPWLRAQRFREQSNEHIRPIFNASLNEDKRGIKRAEAVLNGVNLDRATSLKKWFGLAFGDALTAAARDKLHIHRGIMRTVNLVEKPGDFLKDQRVRWTILGYMLRGRKRNARARIQPGPERLAMLEHVASLQPVNQADRSLPKAAASAS